MRKKIYFQETWWIVDNGNQMWQYFTLENALKKYWELVDKK